MTRAAIINAFDPETYKGGIETFIGNLKELLVQHRLIVDIHCLVPQPTLPVKPFPVTLLHNKIPELILNCFMMGRAFSKIEKTYDLVITNNFYGLGYFAPRVRSFNIYHSSHAAYADALKGKISDLDYRDLKLYFGHIGDRMSGRKKHKIAVSQSVSEELRRYYGFNEITVVNHGIDTHFFRKIEDTISLRQKWDIPSDAFVGIFVGRWEPGKGTDILEEAINIRHDVLWVLVIGDSECPLSGENIKIIKNADRESLRELYSLSDFMLFPSYYEGFGLVIIEAMACKLPVICTKVGVAKDLSMDSDLKKLILDPSNKINLLYKINKYISFLKTNPDEKERIITAGRNIIERYYSMEIWKENMVAVLSHILHT